MNKLNFLFLLILLIAITLDCDRDSVLYIYQPPDTTSTTPATYLIKVSKTYDTIFANSDNLVQDFDIYGHTMYIWPIGAIGLLEYHLIDSNLVHLLSCGSGDFIAADSGRIFYAMSGCSNIRCFYPSYDSSEHFIEKPGLLGVNGMQVYENKLFVLFDNVNNNPDVNVLDIYDLGGKLIESIPYPRRTSYMTINRDILYSTFYKSDTICYDDYNIAPTIQHKEYISRFDLNTRKFLDDVASPSTICDGIRSYGDYFFFTDMENRFIGYVALDEIENR